MSEVRRFPREINELIILQLLIHDQYDPLRKVLKLYPEFKDIVSRHVLVLVFYDLEDPALVHNLKHDPKIDRMSSEVRFVNLNNIEAGKTKEALAHRPETMTMVNFKNWDLRHWIKRNFSYISDFKMINLEFRTVSDCIHCQFVRFNLELFSARFPRKPLHIQIYRIGQIVHCAAEHIESRSLFDKSQALKLSMDNNLNEFVVDCFEKLGYDSSNPNCHPSLFRRRTHFLKRNSRLASINSNIRTIDLMCARLSDTYCFRNYGNIYNQEEMKKQEESIKNDALYEYNEDGKTLDYAKISAKVSEMNLKHNMLEFYTRSKIRLIVCRHSGIPLISNQIPRPSELKKRTLCFLFAIIMDLENKLAEERRNTSDPASMRIRVLHTDEDLQDTADFNKLVDYTAMNRSAEGSFISSWLQNVNRYQEGKKISGSNG